MAGFSQRRSAALALRRLVQGATSAGSTSQLRSSPLFRQLHSPSLLPGACHGQLETPVLDRHVPSRSTDPVRAFHPDSHVVPPVLGATRIMRPQRLQIGASQRRSWQMGRPDGQVSDAGWLTVRSMSGGPPLEESLTAGGEEHARDKEVVYHDKLKFDNSALLKIWLRVRRLPEQQQLVMPTVLTWMGEPGNKLDKDLALALVRRLKQRRRYKHATELCDWIINRSGWETTAFDYKYYVDACCRGDRISKAEMVFASMPDNFKREDVLVGILSYYARKGMTNKLEARINEAREQGIPTTTMTYNTRLQGWGRKGEIQKLPEIFQEMRDQGCEINKQTYNIMIDQYGKAGMHEEMQRLFEEMKANGLEPDEVTYNTLAWSYFTQKKNEAAEAVIAECMGGPGPSLSTYLTMMWAYSRQGKVEKMDAVFEEMKKKGLPLFRQIWMARIHGYGRAGDPDRARKIFEEMAAGPHMPVTMSYNCLLSAYTLNGRMKDAEALLQEMRENDKSPDGVSYQYMLKGYIAQEDFKSAAETFHAVAKNKSRSDLRPSLRVFFDLVEPFIQKGEISHVDKLMFEAGRMYPILDAQVFNTWLNAHVLYRQKLAEGTVTFPLAATSGTTSSEGGVELAVEEVVAESTAEGEGSEASTSALEIQRKLDGAVLRILRKMERVKFSPTLRTMDLIRQLGAEHMAASFGWTRTHSSEQVNTEEGEKGEVPSGESEHEEGGEHESADRKGELAGSSEEELKLAAIRVVEAESSVKQSQPA